MKDIILLKQGEIVLKGLNRRSFELKLISNAKRMIKDLGEFHIYGVQSAIYVEPKSEDCDLEEALNRLKKLFGVVSLSIARACEKDKDEIYKTAVQYLGESVKNASSFKVETKRADKRFPMTSIELSQYVGGLLADDYPETKVDVKNPELIVNVEVRDFSAYVHGNSIRGAGGMPVGSNGRAVTLLSGGIDSPVSSYMIARRGVQVIPVHFFSYPYTSEKAKEKVLELAKILTGYCGTLNVEVVPFTKIQEEIGKKCPEELYTIVMRRFMMRISEKIAERNGCSALVTGENLGQVASQTMQAMAVTEECVNLPILRPLVGMDKRDIIEISRHIETFDTSILPYEDCCTVFTPRHPRTKPKIDEVVKAEADLDIDALVNEAFENIERVRIYA